MELLKAAEVLKAESPKQGQHTRSLSRKVAGPQQAMWVAGWSSASGVGRQQVGGRQIDISYRVELDIYLMVMEGKG